MKKNVFVILVGVTALHVVIFSGLFASGGCKNVVMDERRYVPAEETAAPEAMKPMDNAPPTADFRPAEPQTRPVAVPKAESTFKPMDTMVSKPVSTPAAKAVPGGTYVVKAGDTVGKIAHNSGVSLSAMLKANNLDLQSARKIRVGQKLVIPGKGAAASMTPKTTPKRTPVGGGSGAAVSTAALAADGAYVVKSGDSIPKIARKLGVKASDLQKANNLSDEATRRLQIGQKLVVPGKGGANVAAAPVNNVPTPVAVVPTTTPTTDAVPVVPSEGAEIDLSAALNDAANAATPVAAPSATAPAATPAAEVVIGNSTPVEVTEEVTLEVFAANNKTTAEALKKLNSDLPADGKLKPGLILFVPAAE